MPKLSFEWRTHEILRVLEDSRGTYLSPADITEKYMGDSPTTSDKLTTLNICNVLSAAGLILRKETYPTKSKRVKFMMGESRD